MSNTCRSSIGSGATSRRTSCWASSRPNPPQRLDLHEHPALRLEAGQEDEGQRVRGPPPDRGPPPEQAASGHRGLHGRQGSPSSSRPTSRPAGSTSKAWRWSSTTTSPRTSKITSTGSGGRPGRESGKAISLAERRHGRPSRGHRILHRHEDSRPEGGRRAVCRGNERNDGPRRGARPEGWERPAALFSAPARGWGKRAASTNSYSRFSRSGFARSGNR